MNPRPLDPQARTACPGRSGEVRRGAAHQRKWSLKSQAVRGSLRTWAPLMAPLASGRACLEVAFAACECALMRTDHPVCRRPARQGSRPSRGGQGGAQGAPATEDRKRRGSPNGVPGASTVSGCRYGRLGSDFMAVTCGRSGSALPDDPALTPCCHGPF